MTDTFDDYHLLKGWSKNEFASSSNSSLLETYASLIRTYLRGSITAALDFGFGNGEMLQAFKKLQINEIYGVETNAALVIRANEIGYLAYNSLSEVDASLEGKLDLITAMHVMEHIDYRALSDILEQFSKLLRPGGYLVTSFPNGESPFSNFAFHSDPTHITLLTREKCRILTFNSPLELVTYKAFPAIGRHSNKFLTRVLSRFREIAENFIYFLLAKSIFGSENVLMNPLAVAVWRKSFNCVDKHKSTR